MKKKNFIKENLFYILIFIIILLLIFILTNKSNEGFQDSNNFKYNKDNKITVILNVYKRPHVLIEQITAVKKQTFSPEKIIIYKNFVEGIELPKIPDELNKNITIIESSENFGVWGRFAIGLLANTEYVCIFDDDTIPMPKWFENCINTMKVTPGLLGTNGVIFKKGVEYNGENVGWNTPNETTKEVDIVGHSWFFKREWLQYLWDYIPNYDSVLRRGEDIAFSAMLQKNGIKTYVPAHPKDEKDLWGSNPELALKYGREDAAISMEDDAKTKFNTVLKHFIEDMGFITINNKTN